MRWMEFIKVQSAKSQVKDVLLTLVEECKDCKEVIDAKVFNCTTVDVSSICLLWDTETAMPQGSLVGLAMSKGLKRYGLVDHSVWAEEVDDEEEIA